MPVVLVDTSVWVDYLRRGADGGAGELDGLLARGEELLPELARYKPG